MTLLIVQNHHSILDENIGYFLRHTLEKKGKDESLPSGLAQNKIPSHQIETFQG